MKSLKVYESQPEVQDLIVDEATIACIIPAYNEEDSIERTLESLMTQTRPPNIVHVVVNNTSDDTTWIARNYEGVHEIEYHGQLRRMEIVVHDIGKNKDKKVGALNYGWELSKEFDFILGVDGDTVLDRKCVEKLEAEMLSDTRIGGISAIYSFDRKDGDSAFEKFLIAGQRQQFAGFELDNLLRNRNMAVLGGQCSLLRSEALVEVMKANRQSTPWVTDSSVEDSLLSLQIKSAGYMTKISATARANVGAMTTMKSLYAQQVKWTAGGIELMRQNPFHPNLRLRWRENAAMVFNISTRVLFVLLLAASISISAFVFHPIWLIPPVAAWLLNIRLTATMKEVGTADRVFSWSFVLAEVYMLIRITHFIASWYQSFSNMERDNWSAQANAESGKGSSGIIWPIAVVLIVGAISYFSWTSMDVVVQSVILAIGWPILAVISAILTLTMVVKLFRRQLGYKV